MASSSRPHPVIPDHEVLRKIGGGAYGEVWLARGVTGAMRAVKVVWREDFEDERSFEREFEGIQKFEPISRDHPGLVHVLHVGRSPDLVSFYYYVMELGDDVRLGREIHPVEYEAKTLRADGKAAKWIKLPVDECLEVGLRLAEALEHLHERGLAHRDVKPSNVIFVGGKAKLADIGLVAARGQRTFVGTEGFVPPEGPGSAQADVYSLGKVLYEIATGKDRLDFPELPDELPEADERKKWLALNRIICDVCEPQLSKRTIRSAAELADALRRIQRGKRRRLRRGLGVAMTLGVILLAGVYVAWKAKAIDPVIAWWQRGQAQMGNAEQTRMGFVKIWSEPAGAEVRDAAGKNYGETQTAVLSFPVGSVVDFTIHKEGFRVLQVQHEVKASGEPQLVGGKLEVYAPPVQGVAWSDQLGIRYLPEERRHVSQRLVSELYWRAYARANQRDSQVAEVIQISEMGVPAKIVVTSPAEAEMFCRWLQSEARPSYLTEDQEILPRMESAFQDAAFREELSQKGWRPFRVVVRPVPYASLEITTQPPNAEIYINNESRGRAASAMLLDRIRPGSVDVMVLLDGYKPKTFQLTVQEGERMKVPVELQENQGVVFGKPWKNALGMRFVPLGSDLMVSVWETRVRDYQLFLKEQHRSPFRVTEFTQSPDHPVVYVSRDDAKAFCQWLTERERKEERIQLSHEYRLPTDAEWSSMAGLEHEEGDSPGARDGQGAERFPWGASWPPPPGVGNLADESALRATGIRETQVIRGYDDGYEKTAPVGMFAPNAAGIFDLCGNVHEWVADDYDSVSQQGVLRGGGWNTHQSDKLNLSFRHPISPDFHDNTYGFRVVLAKVSRLEDNDALKAEGSKPETPINTEK